MTANMLRLHKANFIDEDNYELISFGRITKKTVTLNGASVSLVRFPVGASVTEDAVKTGVLDADMCPMPHFAYILQGTLGVRQRNGAEETFSAGEVMMLPPEHEAWSVGDEDCEFIEFMRGTSDVYDFWPDH